MKEYSCYPEFGLRMFGDDDRDHDGLDWIMLICPQCQKQSKFSVKETIIIEKDYERHKVRKFYSKAQCDSCGEELTLQCSDYDDDRDYLFEYDGYTIR